MTKDFTVRGICHAKKGLMFLRDCGEAASAQCHKCGRPICEKHQVPVADGVQCPECAAKDQPGDTTTTRTTRGGSRLNVVDRTRFRWGYYDRYGYMPWYFGHSHRYYSDRDYRSFDEDASEEALAAAQEMDGAEDAEFNDLDDFMES